MNTPLREAIQKTIHRRETGATSGVGYRRARYLANLRAAAICGAVALSALAGFAAAGGPNPPGTMSNIQHAVIIIQENHSFDAYFGRYCTASTGSNPSCTTGPACCERGPGADPVPFKNGVVCKNDTFCLLNDTTNLAGAPGPNWYLPPGGGDGAYYHELASQNALADRYFQPIGGWTGGNLMYFARAQFVFQDNEYLPEKAVGLQCEDPGDKRPFISYNDKTIADLLVDAGWDWSIYLEGYKAMKSSRPCPVAPQDCPAGKQEWPCVYSPDDNPFAYFPSLRDKPQYMKDHSQFFSDVDNGHLPAVSFIRSLGYHSEHPNYSTITAGVNFVKGIVDKIMTSKYVDDTLILLTWDEGGGFFDHVTPPPGKQVDGKEYGGRVPLIAIGKFARKNYICHEKMEHSSIVKFIEWNWLGGQTGQLNGRDKTVKNILCLLENLNSPNLNLSPCGAGPVNACGGCNSLPAGSCQDPVTKKCGKWKCIGKESAVCDTTQGFKNECGGCAALPAVIVPGTGQGHKGDECICKNGDQKGWLVCAKDKQHLICCPCSGAPGCGPGAP